MHRQPDSADLGVTLVSLALAALTQAVEVAGDPLLAAVIAESFHVFASSPTAPETATVAHRPNPKTKTRPQQTGRTATHWRIDRCQAWTGCQRLGCSVAIALSCASPCR